MTTERTTLPATDADPALLGVRQFRAMNTYIDLYVRDIEDVEHLAAVEEIFHDMEDRLSRFRPHSELCRLNERSGEAVAVSAEMFDILSRAAELHAITGRTFDPAILPHLESAGYDRSFELIATNTEAQEPASRSHMSIAQLTLAPRGRTVRAPEGLRIDLGGIGKGFTVDAAARALQPVGNFVVNAGGDIYASGEGWDGDGWLVAITDPRGPGRSLSLVRLYDQALATSTTALRRWTRGERTLHHLIDPRTQQPSESGVMSVSVIAGTAAEADVFAKSALLMGAEAGARFLARQGAAGLFVMDDESIVSAGWPGTFTNTQREEDQSC